MNASDDALDYLAATSEAMADAYVADCVVHACALAERLAREGRRPWIASLRRSRIDGEHVVHEPLIPRRFSGRNPPQWNVHYVCCCDGDAYDPLVGAPLALDGFAQTVFGIDVPIAEHLSPDATAERIANGTLREAFRVRR